MGPLILSCFHLLCDGCIYFGSATGKPREFASKSFGYYVNGKLPVTINGEEVVLQVGRNALQPARMGANANIHMQIVTGSKCRKIWMKTMNNL